MSVGLPAHLDCLNSVLLQDYELQLASYTSGLETLLNIPIKRSMVQSPSGVIMQEVRVPSVCLPRFPRPAVSALAPQLGWVYAPSLTAVACDTAEEMTRARLEYTILRLESLPNGT